MLQALYQMAQDEGLLEDPDFEPKPVAYIVRVGDGGKLIGIEGTHTAPPVEGKKKPKPIAKAFRIPRQPTGRAGTKAPAAFLVDNAKYVFGLPTSDKPFSPEEGQEKSGWFRELVAKCAEATEDRGVQAVLELLERVASGKQEIELAEDCKSNELFAFIYAPDVDTLVHDRPTVRDFWKQKRKQPAGETESAILQCLVTGQVIKDVGLFPLIKRVPGGATAGVGLVSFNKSAFWSHGWENNENAPISRAAAEGCATALNRLINPAYPDPKNPYLTLRPHHIRLSDDTIVCYWARGKRGADLADWMSELLNATDPDKVADVYRSLWTGYAPKIDDPSAFCAVTISGAQGRAVIRDWFETTVHNATVSLRDYFEDLAIVAPIGDELSVSQFFPLFAIKASIARDAGEIPAVVMRNWWHVAIQGAAISDTIALRALSRIRALISSGERPYPSSFGILKAWLIRTGKDTNMTVFLNKTHPSAAYHSGRMLALLGFIQQRALDSDRQKPAASIRRYFGAVMTSPSLYLGRLQKLAIIAHFPKLENDIAGMLKDEMHQISCALTDEVPRTLRMHDQSQFALGFHHEQAFLDAHPPKVFKYRTERGEWVRSKGEVAVANALMELNIDYVYEPVALLKSGRERWPDFMVPALLPKDRIYIEYLGMLDLEVYRQTWDAKLADYRDIEILPASEGGGKNGKLYWIEADDKRPDTNEIREQLRIWLKIERSPE